MDFQVPKRSFYYLPNELNLFTWYSLFPLCFILIFFSPIKFSRLSYNNYSHLSLLCRENLISFSSFGFISHTTRILNKTSSFFKRWAVKKINLETIFSRFKKLKCFEKKFNST